MTIVYVTAYDVGSGRHALNTNKKIRKKNPDIQDHNHLHRSILVEKIQHTLIKARYPNIK